MGVRIDRRDLKWVILIAVSFVVGLAVSWERWGNLLVDCGREMNQPLRLARGEMLYSGVRHIYGPLSPYLNATLFRICGPSLTVLYADGIITALIIIALVYWLARQLMGRAPSAAAALSVMWLCGFKQAGNYILPYSYSALHGCALGLVTLALVVKAISSHHRSAIEKRRHKKSDIEKLDQQSPDASKARDQIRSSAGYYLIAAGVAAGLTTLAKTEMGLAAMTAGAVAAALVGYGQPRRLIAFAAMFLAPALCVSFFVYWQIASRVGWQTLLQDSFLFFQNIPPELLYFNRRVSGFDQPGDSVLQMLLASLKVALVAILIASVSTLLARRQKESIEVQVVMADGAISDAGRADFSQLKVLLVVSMLMLLSFSMATRMHWDKGPYLAMPLLLGALLVWAAVRFLKERGKRGIVNERTIVLMVIAAYSLASLTRVFLRVRSGGAYSSYLLPSSVILFTYCWMTPFARMFRFGRTRRLARNIAVGLLMADVTATAALLGYRFQEKNTYPITTPRGTNIAVPDLGRAFDEAINYIERETAPGEPVAVMPEGTSLNFLTGRPNPLREEILTPGFLDLSGERQAIKRLIESNTQLVLVTNRPTSEFGATIFGRDYCVQLMRWIEDNFEQVAMLGPDHNPSLSIGDKTFFIRAYRKKGTGDGGQEPGDRGRGTGAGKIN